MSEHRMSCEIHNHKPCDCGATVSALVDEARGLAASATPGPWQSVRAGNQYVGTSYMPTAKLVGASVVTGLARPWNPHASVAYGVTATQNEEARLLDADADFIAWCRTGVPALCDALEAVEAERDKADRLAIAQAERCRLATQTIIEAIGLAGPESIEAAVARIVSRIALLERNTHLGHEFDDMEEIERANRGEKELAKLRAAYKTLRSAVGEIEAKRLLGEVSESTS